MSQEPVSPYTSPSHQASPHLTGKKRTPLSYYLPGPVCLLISLIHVAGGCFFHRLNFLVEVWFPYVALPLLIIVIIMSFDPRTRKLGIANILLIILAFIISFLFRPFSS